MANTIAYAQLFQKELDRAAVQASVTGWMDANAGQVIYNGGKDIKIPKMDMDGLGDYKRDTGYEKGAITLTYETKTMTQDRGKQFILDAMDVNESNFVVNAGAVMGEFQRLKVIPEIDAYRLSKVATDAITLNQNLEYSYTPADTNILKKLKEAIAAVKKQGFIGVPLVIHATTDVVTALELALADKIRDTDFAKGGITTKVPSIDGVPIIETAQDRMYTAIQVKSTAQGGGYAKGLSAKDINFIVMPMIAPIGVNKQDNMKIFDPSVVQDHDGWKLDYRRYHDLWVKDHMVKGIFCNIKDSE